MPLDDNGFWIITGEVEVENNSPHSVEWTVDTGAGADGTHYIPEEALDELVDLIERTGATVSEYIEE